MINKILVIFGICFIVFGLIFIFDINKNEENLMEKQEQVKVFEGPVPEGCDEEHFRNTGITKLINE